ncbi:MAG: glycosyltransferase family 2 protein [Lachnospiraceae bacterium]|nr:glycosyltransferase family 2 protein [Lachnospiraceae bacterium]
MNKARILLFIPAYNCEKQIVRVLDSLDSKVMQYIDDIIVINNRSTDNTEEAVREYMKEHPYLPVSLFRNKDNYGLGGSHKVAFNYAIKQGYDYVIVLHGDDQGDIHDFLPVLKKEIYRGYDCVLGARFMMQSRLEGYSLFRTFGNIVYNFLYAMGIRRRVFDLGSGLNMYDVKMLRDKFYMKFPDNLMFNCTMLLATDYYNMTMRFYPVSWKETDQVSNVKMASQSVKTLKLLFDYMDMHTSIRGEYRDIPRSRYEFEEVD